MSLKHFILRQVENETKNTVVLPPELAGKKIVQVWTLLNEELYNKIGLQHWKSAFVEDKGHDWDIRRDGTFHFYGHSGERGELHDLVIVYED